MKVHVLSNPHRPTTTKYADYDPFAIITHEYVHNMKERDCEIIHYGLEGSDVNCEHHSLSSNLEEFNKQASEIIGKRKNPGDVISCMYGWANKEATDAHTDLRIIEPAIGYSAHGTFAPFKVFKSNAHMQYFYGAHDRMMTPSWFDEVIPWGRDPADFTFTEHHKKEDYFLCFGRVNRNKGVALAIDVAEKAGVKLVVAGPGSLYDMGYLTTPKHVEVVGECDSEQRKKLMAGARGLFGATFYLEPFGLMVIEGYFSGTPAITTDWGAFPETVVQGKTGYRCRQFSDFVTATRKINEGEIQSIDCLDYAIKNYSNKVVFDKHYKYIQRVNTLNFYS